MNDKKDLGNVIRGLECCVLRDPDDERRCAVCPYNRKCNRLKMDALEFLTEYRKQKNNIRTE